jgi:hypothetical protein
MGTEPSWQPCSNRRRLTSFPLGRCEFMPLLLRGT